MLQIFNKKALTRKQRLSRAILFGSLAALLSILIEYVLIKVFYVDFSILYLAIGLGIGYCIQYFGKGVQVHFSLLASLLTIIVILICDLIMFGFDFTSILENISQYGSNSLFELAYRIGAIVLAYRYARVV